jgi:hypothetical protein
MIRDPSTLFGTVSTSDALLRTLAGLARREAHIEPEPVGAG